MRKNAPYWHPAFPMMDGRRYCPIERKDAAGLLREHHKAHTVYVTQTAHGQRVYVLHTPGRQFESGRIYMARGN